MADKEHCNYLTPGAVAEMMGIAGETVRRHVREGRLRAVRIGRQIRIPREALDNYITEIPFGEASPAFVETSADEARKEEAS